MAKIITIFLAFCLIFSLALIVYAHAEDTSEEALEDETVNAEDLDNKEPNLLPGDPLYFVKEWGRAIRGVFAFGQLKKAELNQDIANERLLELKKLVEEGKVSQEVLEKTIEKYERTLEKIKEASDKIKEKAQENEEVSKFLDKYTRHQLLHQKILQKLENQVKEEALDRIKEARERHLERFGEVMTKLEEREEKIRERIEKSLENEKGSQFKNFKNLERLIEIEEEIPEQAKEAIRQAQENALKRLKDGLEGMSGQDQERFKEYLEKISGDKNLQLQILERIEEKIENKVQLKERINEAREKIIKRINEEQTDNKACITLWDPVCGKNGKTYSNKCFAEIAGVEVEQKGECEEKPPVSGIECKKDADCPRALRPCVPELDGTLICPEPKCVEGKCTIVFVPSKENSSGIKGKISYGPAQPGPCTSGVNCNYAPYNGKIIIKSKDKSQIIATSETDNNGEFKISLDPQIYFLEVDRKFIITCGKLVEVRPSEYTEVEISCDTGIR